MSYHPIFSNHQIFGTYIFVPEILEGNRECRVSNPNGESATQPRNPGKLLRSMATSAVPFADFQNDGVDG